MGKLLQHTKFSQILSQGRKSDLTDAGRNSFFGCLMLIFICTWLAWGLYIPLTCLPLTQESSLSLRLPKINHIKYNTISLSWVQETHMCSTRVYFHHRNNLNKTGLSDSPITKAISTQHTYKLNTNPKIYFQNTDWYYCSVLKFLFWGKKRAYIDKSIQQRVVKILPYPHLSPQNSRHHSLCLNLFKHFSHGPFCLSFSLFNILFLHSCLFFQSTSFSFSSRVSPHSFLWRGIYVCMYVFPYEDRAAHKTIWEE